MSLPTWMRAVLARCRHRSVAPVSSGEGSGAGGRLPGAADPALPGPLVDRIGRVTGNLRDGPPCQDDLDAAVSGLSALPLASVAAAGAAVAELVLRARDGSRSATPQAHRAAALARLRATAGLERLFVFHPDGYVREAALRRLGGPARTAFEVAAIALRLNDWVGPVRVAARDAAARVLPETDAAIAAEALVFLLDRMPEWQRWRAEWGESERVLDDLMERPDICARLTERLSTARTGRMGRLLQRASRWPDLDAALPDLARQAFLPSVRARALRLLIEERATWPEGYRRQWVDKTYGRTHRVRVIGERPIVRTLDLATLIARGAQDRSAVVRRVAADGLAMHRASLGAPMQALVERLADDASPSVRWRAAFILKERAAR